MGKFTDFFSRSSPVPPSNSGIIVGRLYGNTLIPTGVLSASNAMTNSDIYAVVSLISSDIASMQFHSDELTEQVLNNPTKTINSYNFFQSIVAKMLLYGNSYVLINKDKSVITGLEMLEDDQIGEVIVSDDGQDVTYLVHFNDNRPDTYYDSSEILHFKLITVGSDTNDKYFGKSPLMSLAPELGIQSLSNKLIESTLKNGINPSVMIKIPEAQLDGQAKDNIRNGFISASTGKNTGKPIVLDSSAQLEQLGISPEVSNFLANINFTKTQVAKAFGISDSMILGTTGDAQSNLDMINQSYQRSLTKYKNAIQYELSLKFGVPIQLASEVTDDQLITRVTSLVTNNIISAGDAEALLKQKGII